MRLDGFALLLAVCASSGHSTSSPALRILYLSGFSRFGACDFNLHFCDEHGRWAPVLGALSVLTSPSARCRVSYLLPQAACPQTSSREERTSGTWAQLSCAPRLKVSHVGAVTPWSGGPTSPVCLGLSQIPH